MSAVMGSEGPSWEFKKGKPVVVAAKAKFQAVLNKKGTVVRVPQADVSASAAADSDDSSDAQCRHADRDPTENHDGLNLRRRRISQFKSQSDNRGGFWTKEKGKPVRNLP